MNQQQQQQQQQWWMVNPNYVPVKQRTPEWLNLRR